MSLWRWLGLGALAATRWRQKRREEKRQERERIVPEGEPDRRAEGGVILLLLCSALCSAAFIGFYATDSLPDQTQLMGASIGLALIFLAWALIVVGKRLVVTEEIEEEYPPVEHEEDKSKLAQLVSESGSRFTRKRALGAAAGTAAGALGLAAITPVVSLGPVFDVGSFYRTPWTPGRRLVDDAGKPVSADDIEQGTFYTAYPEGADRELLGAPVVVVRLDPAALQLPRARQSWAPEGILAFSKVCTHAGCAIALYRKPLFPPAEPRPALVCPCHYSTFDPATGGQVIFGPAGRPLPQLPLAIDTSRDLRAAGNFDEPVGPSWWGVRLGKARS